MLLIPLLVSVVLTTPATPFLGGAQSEIEGEGPVPVAAAWSGRTPREATQETGFPRDYDWRNQSGISYMSPVVAQGACGSCTSFAAVAALEAQLNIACSTPNRSFAFSRQFNFSCGGGLCRSGWKLSAAVDFLAESGVPDEPCLPYAAVLGDDVRCDLACSDSTDRAVRGISYERPTSGFINVADIKRGILRGPLIANMILFDDLKSYRGGVYRHRGGMQLGSHAIVLVGWRDDDLAWIVRNSWGPEFGDGGYFEVAWDDASLPGRYTWALDVSGAVSSGICARSR